MADLLCKIPTFYPIPQNRFVVLFPEEIAVDGYVVSKVEFINDKIFCNTHRYFIITII